jgi:hypothetical protein
MTLKGTKNFLVNYRHRISAAIFFGSFAIDAKFLPDSITRESLFIVGVYMISSILVFWLFARACGRDIEGEAKGRWTAFSKVAVGFLMQFVFGALASALFVFYFRGADIAASLPFLFILLFILFANEFGKDHLERIEVRFAGLLFIAYAFALYIIPVAMQGVNDKTFAVANLVAIIYALILVLPLKVLARNLYERTKTALASILVMLFLGFPVLVHVGLVPPLPLVLREGRIAHSVSRGENGAYNLMLEQPSFIRTLDIPFLYPTYHIDKSSEVAFYTAIGAPTNLSTTIEQEWEKQDPDYKIGHWRSVQLQKLFVQGGRKGGFRTYSVANVTPGKWRVTARLSTGQVLGVRTFIIKAGEPNLVPVQK